MLFEKISDDVKTALKSRKPDEVLTLRTLLADIKNFQIRRITEEAKKDPSIARDQSAKPSDEDVFAVLTKNLKQMEENLEIYINSKRADLLKLETNNIAIYKRYLPEQMSAEEISQVIDNVMNIVSGKTPKELFGMVMKTIIPMTKGRADSNLVSKMVKEKIGI